MRIYQSDSIRVSGNTLAHFHPDCGDALLDFCEERLFFACRDSDGIPMKMRLLHFRESGFMDVIKHFEKTLGALAAVASANGHQELADKANAALSPHGDAATAPTGPNVGKVLRAVADILDLEDSSSGDEVAAGEDVVHALGTVLVATAKHRPHP
jgi:hypothetical protein